MADVPSFCAARPDGQVVHLIDAADLDRLEADMTAENLVVVPCPAHDTPGHAWARLNLPPIDPPD